MRQSDHFIVSDERTAREIRNIGVQMIAVQRRQNGFVIDDFAAREIQYDCTLRHQADTLRVNKAARRIHERHMQGQNIGAARQVIETAGLLDAGGQFRRPAAW